MSTLAQTPSADVPVAPGSDSSGTLSTGDRYHVGNRDFALLLVQLVLLIVVVWQFELEKLHHLPALLILAGCGFVLHSHLPVRLRLGAFVLLSIGAIVLVLGPLTAAYVLAAAAILIALACAPAPLRVRVPLVLLAGGALAWLRRDSIDPLWAVLGSLFMFRLIVFFHSEATEQVPASFLQKVAYFLLLPNAFFPLFPVVDYQTFCTTYYDAPARNIYQRGIHWIAVGVGHLLVYRIIRLDLLPSPLEVRSLWDVLLFFGFNYALYVRVSGQFHIICGILHLFGFHLPRTHDHYFLAASFGDIWRRINIYWKDFCKKLLFYPAFFRLRRWGTAPAIALSVLWVFFGTWLAHSYQTWWLLGEFPLTATNFLLWMGVGVVVAVNSLLEARSLKRTNPAPMSFSFAAAAIHALKVIGVFLSVSVFWAFWSNSDLAETLLLAGIGLPLTAEVATRIVTAIVAAVAIGVAAQWWLARQRQTGRTAQPAAKFEVNVAAHLVPLIVVIGLTQLAATEALGTAASTAITELRSESVTRGDVMELVDGYYEQINEGSLQASPFLGDPIGPLDLKGGRYSAMVQDRNDLLGDELIPGWSGEFSGAHVTVNRWGMRDRPRTLEKPAGTYRIALIGSSVVMGYGVGDEETFAHLLEQRLIAEQILPGRTIEVLNFGMGQHFSLQRRAQLEHKALAFSPDLVIYFAHQDEYYTSVNGLAAALYAGFDVEDPALEALLAKWGIAPGQSEGVISVTLNQHYEDVAKCTYRRLSELCQARGAALLWVYLPVPGKRDLPYDARVVLPWARDSGLEVIELDEWWAPHEPGEVVVGSGDTDHPNALGHQLLATAVEALLRQHGLGSNSGQTSPDPAQH